jgi:hypothetical protein
MRLWRHLLMLKRAGRGHDPAGIDATSQGELAVECPACPHPGRNLPEDWKLTPPEVMQVSSATATTFSLTVLWFIGGYML